MLNLEKAFAILDENSIRFKPTCETITTNDGLGRILAEDQYSLLDLPSFNKAAMDGYAILANDTSEEFQVIETVMAGECPRLLLQIGTATKVMTGAPVPLNTAQVVPHELTREENGCLIINKKPETSHICWRGEDSRRGTLVIRAPIYLGSLEIATLIASGITTVNVFKRLRVIIISTGNEIVNQVHEITFGKIMNSNGPMLYNLCQQYNLEIVENLLLKDDYQLTLKVLHQALNQTDIVIFSGGVSAGDFDFVGSVLNNKELKLHFNSVALKPGKPITFATTNDKLIFGLPGNPVSVYLTFHLFILRALKKILGFTEKTSAFPLSSQLTRRNTERTEYLPAKLQDGVIIPIKIHGSADLHGLLAADGFFAIPRGVSAIDVGTMVEFIPIRKLQC